MRKTMRVTLLLLLWARGASAQIPVTDASNLSQNLLQTFQQTLTAVRSQISNVNEVTQIQHQLTSLANEARQLASLPFSLVAEIDQAIRTYTDLLNTGRGIAYSVQAAVEQFEALYSQGVGGGGSFLVRAQRLLDQVRNAGRLGTQATAIFERLCAQQTRVGKLMAASQAAIGQVQAAQSGNQLLGLLVEQQVSVQQILATDQRLKISETMRQLVTEEQAYTNAQAYVQGLVVVPVRGPGEGKGFMLPE
jgi:P-type conjugative transfer protein TrbJ